MRDKAVLELLYSAALRVSELCGLNWADIDWNAKEIVVLGKGHKQRIVPVAKSHDRALGVSKILRAEVAREASRQKAGFHVAMEHTHGYAVDSKNDQEMAPNRRNQQGLNTAWISPFGGDSHAGERRRHSRCSRDARACQHSDNSDLHSRHNAHEGGTREHASEGVKANQH